MILRAWSLILAAAESWKTLEVHKPDSASVVGRRQLSVASGAWHTASAAANPGLWETGEKERDSPGDQMDSCWNFP